MKERKKERTTEGEIIFLWRVRLANDVTRKEHINKTMTMSHTEKNIQYGITVKSMTQMRTLFCS